MREYYGETASTEELYFSNENNESATRSEAGFVIAPTVCCGRTTRCIRVEQNVMKLYLFRKQGHSTGSSPVKL